MSPHTITRTTTTRSSLLCDNNAGSIREALAQIDPDARLVSVEHENAITWLSDDTHSPVRIEFETTHAQETP